MRDIKFRAWVLHDEDGYEIIEYMEYDISSWHDPFEQYKKGNIILLQFTGLRDSHGKEIFEGDILRTSNPNSQIWYVDYKPTAFMANQGNVNYFCPLHDFIAETTVEVIGNIYETPNLLKT